MKRREILEKMKSKHTNKDIREILVDVLGELGEINDIAVRMCEANQIDLISGSGGLGEDLFASVEVATALINDALDIIDEELEED